MSVNHEISDEIIEIRNLSKGDQVRSLRISLKLTQEEFAEILCVEKLTVSRWENGEREIKGPALKLINIFNKYDLWEKEING